MEPIKHVLVATDLGPVSDRALAHASDLALTLGAELVVLHVIELAAYPNPYPIPGVPISVPSAYGIRDDKKRELDGIVESMRRRGIDARGVIREGSSWRSAVAVAEETDAGLIVVGTHGRSGLSRAVLGSSAEQIMRHARIPVVTVPGYFYEDRAHAGRKLARQIAALSLPSPAVFAISRGGIVVAAEVARVLEVPEEILMTRTLERHGARFGAMCEDGTVCLDDHVSAAITAHDRDKIIAKTRAHLRDELIALRANEPPVPLDGRAAVLVSDDFAEPWGPLAAASAAREMGASRIVLAAPIAEDSALPLLARENVELCVLHRLAPDARGFDAYRAYRDPGDEALARSRSLMAPMLKA
jgi:putative phosphoribosyl transferase